MIAEDGKEPEGHIDPKVDGAVSFLKELADAIVETSLNLNLIFVLLSSLKTTHVLILLLRYLLVKLDLSQIGLHVKLIFKW